MIDFSAARIESVSVAKVGKKSLYEGVSSPTTITPNEVLEELLLGFFGKTFQAKEDYFYFDFENNEVYKAIANEETPLVEKLSSILYENSDYQKFNGGEFIVVKFSDILFNGEGIGAIGLWKVNTKEYAIRSERSSANFVITETQCINLKPETAALVLLTEETEGYRVLALDKVTKKGDRSFWLDGFLRLKPIEDDYFQTRRHIALTQDFIENKIRFGHGLNRIDQIDLMNRAALYFKEFDEYEVQDFVKNVFANEEIAEAYTAYRKELETSLAVKLEENFKISRQAVKKEVGMLSNSIKLDKNFKLNLLSRRDLVERGFDEGKGMKYYKVYFENEE